MMLTVESLEPHILSIFTSPAVDLNKITAKQVRAQLRANVPGLQDDWIREHKAEIDALTAAVFDRVRPGEQNDQETSTPPEPETNNHSNNNNKRKRTAEEEADAEYARKLASELNGHNTRAGSVGKKPSKTRRKVKSAEEIEESDEEEPKKKSKPRKSKKQDDGDGETKKRGGYQKEYALSPALAAFTGTPALSRPQIVKKLWDHIKANSLQNPQDKREILCDEQMKSLFGVDKINMFQMNKVIGVDVDLDMSEREFDLLVIGATGYTGQLVIEYLANHPRAPSLRVALGGRTVQKVQELAKKYQNVSAIYVDVSDEPSVDAAVAKAKVVINIAGPYYTRGSVVVKACATHGVHYVDLTGESPWVAQIIERYDYLAHKTGACIVPCSGYDSIPSDIAAYVGRRALEKQLGGKEPKRISSTTAHVLKGGMSGGTAASIFASFEEIPKEQRRKGSGWGLSPVPPPPGFSALPGILYSLPRVTPTIWGGYFLMSNINAAIVRRSWGLQHRYTPASKRPIYTYDEFQSIGGPLKGILLSLTVLLTAVGLALFPPFRWFLKYVMPKSGEGPAPEMLDKGMCRATNVSEADDEVAVKAVFEGNGDPGYRLTSIMIVESALLLLDPENLSDEGRSGGILTPSVAYGDALVKALEATGRFKIGVEVLEDKKTR
ncbi:unnamed protein product [Rhizoctonia solani]|uniref:Saccharopine dehydrogenase NADP binding domain-containing protein n=1 Tax=Rhizoctonia solani TaxID=456999 RepID=A0A8H3AEB7_9AGAM|nr:unnamed protein product [Rhizoctonia solani]